MKRKILPNCLKGEYGYHLEELSNIGVSFVVFGAESVKNRGGGKGGSWHKSRFLKKLVMKLQKF